MQNLAQLVTRLFALHHEPETPAAPQTCNRCQADLAHSEHYQQYRVCPNCGRHFALPARQRIALLADHGTFRETNRNLASLDPLGFSDQMPYAERVREAQQRTGLTDAVVTGTARIQGHKVVLGVMDFAFLGGSMGSVVGEKITRAMELGLRQKLPVILVASSGGARMQEGMLSLVQMAKTATAAQRLHRAGVPLIVILADPTTGGVFASFASLGDYTIAEPGALIGFAGPRVAEQMLGRPLPPGSHTAEFLYEHGLVDIVASREQHRDLLGSLIALLSRRCALLPSEAMEEEATPSAESVSAWEVVQRARRPDRPTALQYISRITHSFIEIHGDRCYGDDPAIVAGLADLDGQTVVIVGQERGPNDPTRRQGRALPEGYRKALRAMELAAQFRLPLVTLVDTPGAYPGVESEERGLAFTIAQCLARLSELPVPVVSVIIGEGGSGGALALAVADRVLMMEDAIYSVIAPEGAATILYRDADRAPELSESLKLTAEGCLQLGVVDAIVPEPAGGAHLDPDRAAQLLRSALVRHLSEIQETSPAKLIRARQAKFRRLGEHGSYYRVALQRELAQLQELGAHQWRFLQEGLNKLRTRWERRHAPMETPA